METATRTRGGAVRNVSESGRPSETVISAVAAVAGVDPLELDPLYDVVDPDALDAIVRSAHESASEPLELRFSMAGCDVVVRGDGEVVVRPRPTDDNDGPTAGAPRAE